MNEAEASTRADAEEVKYEGKNEQAQDMFLWPGIVLQAAVTDRAGLLNALRYRVVEISEETVVMRRINDEGEEVLRDEKPWEVSLPKLDVPLKMRLCYAITYDSSQARTLRGNVRLCQTDHKRMTLRRLSVGLGRCPEGANVEIEK